jgi:hypothetical protein
MTHPEPTAPPAPFRAVWEAATLEERQEFVFWIFNLPVSLPEMNYGMPPGHSIVGILGEMKPLPVLPLTQVEYARVES